MSLEIMRYPSVYVVQKLEGGRREVRGHLTSIVDIFSYPIILPYAARVVRHAICSVLVVR